MGYNDCRNGGNGRGEKDSSRFPLLKVTIPIMLGGIGVRIWENTKTC